MALPDVSTLTVEELDSLAQQVSQRQMQKRAEQEARRQQASVSTAQSQERLDSLIGPDEPTGPSMTSLTEVQLYTDAQIGANLVLGLRLAFEAVEQVARVVRDIAAVVGREQPLAPGP